MSFITTRADREFQAAHRRRQDDIAAQRDADLAYAVGTLDAALAAHARAQARVAARRRAPIVNALMMARMAQALAN